MRAILPCLWFNGNLEEAVTFYLAVFPDAHCGSVFRQGDGALVSAELTLAGHRLSAINGGPEFPFTEAISLVIECDTQDEVDYYWAALTADGGVESQCGWLKDKFGVSWQVIPVEFYQMLHHGTPEAAMRVMSVMFTQRKLELGPLRAALQSS